MSEKVLQTHSDDARQEPQVSRFLFGSRRLDFWMLGGLSIVCWAPVYFFREQLTVFESLTYNVSWIAFYLAYFVNYPHFMASYKLAYSQGRGFVKQNWFQLIVVPVVVLFFIVLALSMWSYDHRHNVFTQGLNNIFSGFGLATRLGQYSSFGAEVMGMLVNFMFFTVGWHYSKQAFGCMMVYARLDGYVLTIFERNLIRYTLLSTWWVTWLNINCWEGSYLFYGLTIFRLNLPNVWLQVSYFIVGLMFVLLVVVLINKYRQQRLVPGLNFMVPMFALAIWHIPVFSNPQFFYFMAFFHSLQYLPFVARVEKTRYEKSKIEKPYKRLGGFFLIMIVLGFISFNFAPNQLDQAVGSFQLYGASFFMIAFLAFINIHHYFIDNVLWRFKNREVRELLFD